jgi:hypothetical protein
MASVECSSIGSMFTKITFLIVAAFLADTAGRAQQSPSSPTTTPQAQTAPCPAQTTNPQPNKQSSPFADKWKKKINDLGNKAAAKSGLPVPTTDDLQQLMKSSGTPCLPKAGATPAANAQVTPAMRLPTGVMTTFLCNPIIISTDPSHTTTFITPDALTIAEPAQESVFEADGAKADLKATVSCANLRKDPRTSKVFLAQ